VQTNSRSPVLCQPVPQRPCPERLHLAVAVDSRLDALCTVSDLRGKSNCAEFFILILSR
jgi:hypothetical protein